ncbi:hypothetical protein CSHISOI_05705 [Colletotrichum shisoi]|uniref:Uncharacterized protein n=1 Tax=Colletotrichum shisoi TaxID=2078593 RepID=A0A5Q4BSJ7_9PEZI|nr:hypothetical protein CSHISOI_05705 [Colletotrichum shisoi]
MSNFCCKTSDLEKTAAAVAKPWKPPPDNKKLEEALRQRREWNGIQSAFSALSLEETGEDIVTSRILETGAQASSHDDAATSAAPVIQVLVLNDTGMNQEADLSQSLHYLGHNPVLVLQHLDERRVVRSLIANHTRRQDLVARSKGPFPAPLRVSHIFIVRRSTVVCDQPTSHCLAPRSNLTRRTDEPTSQSWTKKSSVRPKSLFQSLLNLQGHS